jgi:hypothetical protein
VVFNTRSPQPAEKQSKCQTPRQAQRISGYST